MYTNHVFKYLNITVKLIAAILISLVIYSEASAGVAPGTINRGSYTTSNTCNSTPTNYSPTDAGGYCYNGGGKTGHTKYTYYQCNAHSCNAHSCNPYQCNPQSDGCGGTTYDTCYSTCYDTCYDTCSYSEWVWDTYYSFPAFAPTGTNTLYSYSYNSGNPTWGSSGYSVIIEQDAGESCNRWANGTPHTPATWQTASVSCTDGSSTSGQYVGGASGVCNTFGSKDNLITSFNQLGAISRSAPSDNDSTCTVEGRYATGDIFGPSIVVTGLGVFDGGDQNNWCNLQKYRTGNVTPGCLYYANKAGVAAGSDLLANLGFAITDTTSGISSVTIELGSCSATWDLPIDLATILNSTTSPAGVSPLYHQVNLSANAGSHGSVPSLPLPSLRSKFGVARLDDCLSEGKNYLKVSAADSARASSDGVSFSPNGSSIDYSSYGYVKIDNYSPKLGLGGELATFADSNSPASCFVGTAAFTPVGADWKNYTLNGSIRSTDPFGNNTADCSTVITTPIAVIGTCGASNGSTTSSAPTTGLCATGSPSAVSGTGPWTWTCTGLNGGATNACSANPPASAPSACGLANGSKLTSAPTTGLCATGSPSAVSGTGPWTWTCGGTISCQATKDGVGNPGQCGSAKGIYTAVKPSNNLCSSGTATNIQSSGDGGWFWSCNGTNGGSSDSCTTPGNTLPVCTAYAPGDEFNAPGGDGVVRHVIGGAGGTSCGPVNCNTLGGITGNMYLWTNPIAGIAFPTECRACPIGTTRNTAGDDCEVAATVGSCGPATSQSTETAPTDALCNSGTPTVATAYEDPYSPDLWTKRWQWSCQGDVGTSPASCSSQRIVPAVAKTCEGIEFRASQVTGTPIIKPVKQSVCSENWAGWSQCTDVMVDTTVGYRVVANVGPSNPNHSVLYGTSISYNEDSLKVMYCAPGMTETEMQAEMYRIGAEQFGSPGAVNDPLWGHRRYWAPSYGGNSGFGNSLCAYGGGYGVTSYSISGTSMVAECGVWVNYGGDGG